VSGNTWPARKPRRGSQTPAPRADYQLFDGYHTRLTGLTAGEAESLFLAGLPGPAAELGLGAVLTAAQLKLMVALPVEIDAA
jgi:hypothetical protein